MDDKSGKQRRFISVSLYNADPSDVLERHSIKISVAVKNHFLRDLLFGWVVPFALIFLLWEFLSRKTMSLT